MKSIVIVTIVSVIVSIGIYKGIRKVLYKKDVTNKASFARLIKYVEASPLIQIQFDFQEEPHSVCLSTFYEAN